MKLAPRQLLLATLLAGLGLAANAQTPPPSAGNAPPSRMHEGMHDRMHGHMQDRMARRLGHLKEALRITPAQEGAWTSFAAALKPAERPRPDLGEWARLATPERIDRMRQLRGQRIAESDRRGEATKAFYGQLSADQQRVFDQVTLHHLGDRGDHGERQHGGERGGFRN